MVQGERFTLRSRKTEIAVRILLALIITVAVAVILRNGETWLEQFENHQWSIDLPILLFSALLLLISLAATPYGWVLICRSMGIQIAAVDLFAAWYTCQLGRYIPGKIWLFAGKTAFLKARGTGTGRAAATTAYELLFNVASVGVIALVTAPFLSTLSMNTAMKTAIACSAASLVLLPLLHPFQRYVCSKRGIDTDSLPDTLTALKATGVFTGLWMMRAAALYLLLKGVGINDLSTLGCLAAAPLSWLAGYIVVVIPGGIGVRETAAALIAAPQAAVPAAAAIGGQRIFMALAEVVLALLNSRRISANDRRQDKCG